MVTSPPVSNLKTTTTARGLKNDALSTKWLIEPVLEDLVAGRFFFEP